MKIAILSANLNSFDKVKPPVDQELPEGITEVFYHCYTDTDFPPIGMHIDLEDVLDQNEEPIVNPETDKPYQREVNKYDGLTPRLQYRIPKMFAWQMCPGYDYYLWMDGSVSLQRPDCLKWYMKELGNADMGFFAHPSRSTIKEEVDHIDDYLHRRKGRKSGQEYMISRYNNGLHKEQLVDIELDENFVDDKLYASTMFLYKDSEDVRNALRLWWLHQSRYFTCDQVALPYVLWKSNVVVKTFSEPIFKTGYMSLVSHHK